jgi:hypothetical protein
MVRAILAGMKTQTRRAISGVNVIAKTGSAYWPGGKYGGDFHHLWHCKYGVVGDRLWVRETWARDDNGEVIYRADQETVPYRWRPWLYMPRAASRITLELVTLRAERLHAISEDDILAEGITRESILDLCHDLRSLWARLWDSINGKRAPWASNPWVWRIEFKRLEHDGGRCG